jgi:hypothetical protein
VEPLPRYILHQELGAGGMGVVHLGTLVSPAGHRRVAIKQLVARGVIDERGRARLIAEARLVFRLTHTNICQVLDLGENERGTFVVMELVTGLDLRALLGELRAQGRRLDVASAVYIAREVARALDYAHRRSDDRGAPLGLVHGDVTPQNVLTSIEGEVKLTDFGIARALGTAAPGAGILAGTRGFLAPERASGGGDHRADIYALGVTLLVALGGDGPADATPDPGRLAALRPEVSAELVAIIRRAVAVDPAARFLSAAALEGDLSLELARRFPAFTPSQLAHVVRQCRQRTPNVDEPVAGVATDTLTSLVDDGRTTEPDASPAAAAVAAGGLTQTAAAPLPRRRLGLVTALALLAVAALVAVAVRARRPEPPQTAVRRHRAARGRDRHRQGAGRRGDPRALARAPRGPFVVVDCGAIPPPNLIESELFGHERGAFTGASATHRRCSRPPTAAPCSSTRSASCRSTLQPKLLRALERARSAVGGDQPVIGRRPRHRRDQPRPARRGQPGRFREDLYYRLAVVGCGCRRCASAATTATAAAAAVAAGATAAAVAAAAATPAVAVAVAAAPPAATCTPTAPASSTPPARRCASPASAGSASRPRITPRMDCGCARSVRSSIRSTTSATT